MKVPIVIIMIINLREELGSDHPGYGAWPDGKENNVEESRNYRQPPNPTHKLLQRHFNRE